MFRRNAVSFLRRSTQTIIYSRIHISKRLESTQLAKSVIGTNLFNEKDQLNKTNSAINKRKVISTNFSNEKSRFDRIYSEIGNTKPKKIEKDSSHRSLMMLEICYSLLPSPIAIGVCAFGIGWVLSDSRH